MNYLKTNSDFHTYLKKNPANEVNRNQESKFYIDQNEFKSIFDLKLTKFKINEFKTRKKINSHLKKFDLVKISNNKKKVSFLKNELQEGLKRTGLYKTFSEIGSSPLRINYSNNEIIFKKVNYYFNSNQNKYIKKIVFDEIQNETSEESLQCKINSHETNLHNKLNQESFISIIKEKENEVIEVKKIENFKILEVENLEQIKELQKEKIDLVELEIDEDVKHNDEIYDKQKLDFNKEKLMTITEVNLNLSLNNSMLKFSNKSFLKETPVKTLSSDVDPYISLENCLTKLCNSFSEDHLIYKLKEFVSLNPEQRILKICSPKVITSFKKVSISDSILNCKKIGEGSFGDVYCLKKNNNIFKIIKLPEDNLEKGCLDIFPELFINACLSELVNSEKYFCLNFIIFKKCTYVKGKYPKKLLNEWLIYDQVKKSENENPINFNSNSRFIFIFLENGGCDLENYKLKLPQEAMSIFKQCLFALAVAEKAFQFEHRDLHLENILISKTNLKQLEYIIDYKKYSVKTNFLKISIIDYTLSRLSRDDIVIFQNLSNENDIFEGIGDYQFDIYRMMKSLNKNDWKTYNPKTNVYWLHYLITKLMNIKFRKYKTKDAKNVFKQLIKYEKQILKYNSSFDAIQMIE